MISLSVQAQTRMLDDFETFTGWHAIVSEGASGSLAHAPGRTGDCMAIDFNLEGVSGYVIAEKDVEIDLPSNYQFSFEMKADIPVNNFEFKLIDEKENVFWIKKLNIAYPKEWEKQTIKKRHITFAWGPSGGGEIHHVRKLQIVVSSGQGGRGRILIDNLRFETLNDPGSSGAEGKFFASSFARIPSSHTIDRKATVLTKWEGAQKDSDTLEFDYNYLKEIGGLAIEWDSSRYATAYTVDLSEDGVEWTRVYTVTEGNGGRDYIYLHEKDARSIRLRFTQSSAGRGTGYAIARLEVKGPEFSLQPNNFFTAIAAESGMGLFPKYFLAQQSYWTVSGVNADSKEALINEEGMIEVDKEEFSLEPFIFVGGRLFTWNDVERTQSLEDGYLPIPSVKWTRGPGTLSVRLVSSGTSGASTAIATYRLTNAGEGTVTGKLFIAIRPFQVNPPWQWLNAPGGVSPIRSIRSDSTGVVRVDERTVIPLTAPDGFGAVSFDSGDITEYLTRGILPAHTAVTDQTGFASAAYEYAFTIPAGASKEVHIAVPFHARTGQNPSPHQRDGGSVFVKHAFDESVKFWREKLDRVRITLPAQYRDVINTVKSNLAYILINRDGPGIQPGSRNYERSWIRDGSLTSTALLELGVQTEVREYLDWYAMFQYPSGKIPCVVDKRGADATAEHDSHGEFIYAIRTYFNFTHDTTWLKGKFDHVVKTVRFIQSLRAERKTDKYKNGTDEDRALYGLVPESISHEGYSDHPRHSYWDDFFILRGLKDATDIARVLGHTALEKEFAAERDD
ncbi:MAG TPA: discoidin domain-containing protein, partial [Bacteroidota bacterium]|nr:discoidin domain-containing protein [Bacteroidota bacterium]